MRVATVLKHGFQYGGNTPHGNPMALRYFTNSIEREILKAKLSSRTNGRAAPPLAATWLPKS